MCHQQICTLVARNMATLVRQEVESTSGTAGRTASAKSLEMPYPLTVRDRRVLVPIGIRCPFGCRYCYADDPDITSAPRPDVASILAAVRDLDSGSFDIIQLGYDGDPLASRSALTALLPGLAETGKHINISTKANITRSLRDFLGSARSRTPLGISLNVSVTSWESAREIEPQTPVPYRRLSSASLLQAEKGIPFVVSLRPLLPMVQDDELFRVLDHAHRTSAAAVVTGPLYVTSDGSNMRWTGNSFDEFELADVAWSPIPLRYRRIEDSGRIEKLESHASSIGIPLYSNNASALAKLIEISRV